MILFRLYSSEETFYSEKNLPKLLLTIIRFENIWQLAALSGAGESELL